MIQAETRYRIFRADSGELVFKGNKKLAVRELKKLGGSKAGYKFYYTLRDKLSDCIA